MLLLPRALVEEIQLFRPRPCPLHSYGIASLSRRYLSSSTALKPVRVRFAPSPTGSLHLGGLRTALFNYLFARSKGGQFVLRIEDTDRTRLVPTAQEELIACLKWSGIEYDEGPGKEGDQGPYIQSERRKIYDRHLSVLLEKDHAYRCFCSSERLDALRLEARRTKSPTHYDGLCRHLSQSEIDKKMQSNEPYVVRFRNQGLPEEQNDLVYGLIKLPNIPQEDFILVKSDGMPTYHFANVVDDYEMEISHVLRGEEWIPSTPKHLALYRAFGWPEPEFAHMPILVNPDGSKLSKRSGDVKILDYIKGWEPEALVNFVALMGASWHGSKGTDGQPLTDVMSMPDLVSNFALSNLNKHRSTMGGKIAYLNRNHLAQKMTSQQTLRQLAGRAKEILVATLPQAQSATLDYIGKVLQVNSDRLENLQDLPSISGYFFERPDYTSKEANSMLKSLKDGVLGGAIKKVFPALTHLEGKSFDKVEIAEALRQTGLSGGALMTPLRYILTGQKSGPGVVDIIWVLGKEETLARLARAAEDAK